MDQSITILKQLKEGLNRVRTKEHAVRLIAQSQIVCAWFLGVVTFLAFIELLFTFSASVRTVEAVSMLCTLIAGVVWFIVRPALHLIGVLGEEPIEQTAKRVGEFFPAIRDRLLNALQLEQELMVPAGIYSAELLSVAVEELGKEVQRVDLTQSVNRDPIERTRKPFFVSLFIPIFLVTLLPNGFSGALFRLWHFDREFIPPAEYSFDILPGTVEVVKGSSVPVSVRVLPAGLSPAAIPNTINLFRRTEGQETFEQLTLNKDSAGTFHAAFAALRASVEYFAQTSNSKSDVFKLSLLDRPLLRSLHIRLEYPAYTHLPPKEQDEFVGDVVALAGTRVTISGSSSKQLKEATIDYGHSMQQAVVHGEHFRSSISIKQNGSYAILLTDAQGLKSIEPVRYQLRVLADEQPVVSILEPGRNLDVAGNETLSLLLQAKDDFGFSKLQLGYRLVKSRYEQVQAEYSLAPIALTDANVQQFETIYRWNLSTLHLAPEDVIEYFVEVFDNDVVSGPKSGRSNLYQLRLPSIEEVFSDANKTQDKSIDEIKESLKEAEKLKQEVQDINNDLKKNKEVDWTKQKKMEEMAKRYEEIQKKMEDVGKKLEEMTQQMNQQNTLSKETLEKFLELQNMFQQLDTEELQKALQRMQQPMQNLSKEAMQQAMKQIEFSEEQFRQSIERTLNLLKRIQIEQKMDEVKKRADELARAQEELAKQSEWAANDPQKQEQLAKRQTDLAKEEGRMEEAAKDLQDRMEEFFSEMPADKMQKLNEELKAKNLQDKMKQAGKQLQSGQTPQAKSSQQNASQELREFSEQMSALQQQMMQQQAQMVMNEMRRAINNLLELSKQQEAIKQQAQNAPPNSPQLRENQQRQLQAQQDLNNVVNSLAELSQKSFAVTPEMGKAIGEANARMAQAMRDLDVRNGPGAVQEQQAAMTALNNAATQVQNALQAMMQQGGGAGMGSLMFQLQAMAGQQQGLNMQTQQIPGEGQMSMQQAAEAARIAKEQDAVRKSLEELNKEAEQSQEGKRILGDLQKISNEMREVVRNLEQQNVSPETIQKQERILSRLLDASKSQRERDFEKKRKSETGSQIVRRSPRELDAKSMEQARRRQDLLKSLEQKYSKDYQELIRRYFEELEKLENVEN
jgi:hypothetical protein